MARPIPRYLLPHSATHKYGTPTEDDTGARAWPSSRTLSHVRFEPTSRLGMTKDNQQIQLSAVMFFDCRNSGPRGVSFAIGDQIIRTGGATYTVVGGTEPLFDAGRAHHWEVELC